MGASDPVNVSIIGAGPAGLYLAILLKRDDPGHRVTVYERNRLEDTFGFGVVFSDETLENVGEADPETNQAMAAAAARWEDIEIHYRGTVMRSTGHRFSGVERKTLLGLLARRALALGVEAHWQQEIRSLSDCGLPGADLVVAADGVSSFVRERMAGEFQPGIDWRRNRFVWLGTDYNFPAFTFHFIENAHGLWRTHCYRYEEGMATLIIECTDETFANTGLGVTDEAATAKYVADLLRPFIGNARVITNRSHWRNFPNISCENWHFDNVVLAGDAVHTAHFSIGSGTKLAMEDAIALHKAITDTGSIKAGLPQYVKDYKPQVESLQRAAIVSQRWFEEAERYYNRLDPIQFGFAVLTRSLRISHGNLRQRDPKYVASVDRWFATQAANQSGVNVRTEPAPPPIFTPFRLRDLVLPNRIVVSPMCQYSSEDGMPDDWHLVHLGSRAMGGAGLVIAEMTNVSRDARISPGCTGMYKQEHVAGWKRVTDFVHKHTESKIALQLGHAGRKASTRLLWQGYDEPLKDGNWPIVAASPLPYKPHSQVPREMNRADMEAVIADYVRATKMAEEAGFDMLEVHMAHGYLLNTFISPLTNQRKDDYGGSIANRMRFPLEVYRAVRAAWPQGKPISCRISAHGWKAGGTEPKDAVEIARLLKAAGDDIVDVS